MKDFFKFVKKINFSKTKFSKFSQNSIFYLKKTYTQKMMLKLHKESQKIGCIHRVSYSSDPFFQPPSDIINVVTLFPLKIGNIGRQNARRVSRRPSKYEKGTKRLPSEIINVVTSPLSMNKSDVRFEFVWKVPMGPQNIQTNFEYSLFTIDEGKVLELKH
jgi:hypothetical protein